MTGNIKIGQISGSLKDNRNEAFLFLAVGSRRLKKRGERSKEKGLSLFRYDYKSTYHLITWVDHCQAKFILDMKRLMFFNVINDNFKVLLPRHVA